MWGTTSAGVSLGGEGGAAGGRSAARAAGTEGSVWLLRPAAVNTDTQASTAEKVRLQASPQHFLIYSPFSDLPA